MSEYPTPNTQHPTPASPFALKLFGTFEARVDGQPLPSLRTVKGKYLLALLALRVGQEVSRQWLAENLWPDSETPSDSLRQCLADVKRKLGAQAWRMETPSKATLRLNGENAEIDVAEFEKRIKRGTVDWLLQAVELYQGDLLEGVTDVWILADRETRQQAYLNALETLAAHAHVDGDAQAEIRYLRRMLASDPCRQTATRNLMDALAKAGEPQAAIEAYRQLRQRLTTDSNALPEPEIRALYQRILQQKNGVGKQGKNDKSAYVNPAFTPAPEWEVSSPSVAVGGNVPRALTPLIGREALLRDIKTRLLTTPLVTLVGTGGVGKTRLATQSARELMDSFEDGVWFADLAAVTTRPQVAQEIARIFDIRTETAAKDGNDAARSVGNTLRLRHVLLVLDNCETCLEAAASVAQELSRHCPHLRLLATSRQKLGLASETVVAIKPLETPAEETAPLSGENWRHVADVASVRLFVERAQSARHDFAITSENAPFLAEICQHLDGLPLALELAAPLVEVLTPQEIAAHLHQRFDLLTDAASTRPIRHQSLRAAIASSVDFLPEPEQVLLRRLSVFVGGWTLDGAEAVAKDEGGRMKDEANPHSSFILSPSSFALLRGLVAKSLVVAEEWNGQMRYRMLESIREFAGEMLEVAGETTLLRVRHLDWMTQIALQAESQLTGARQLVWLERLEVETANLRHALDWAEQNVECRTQGLALANALGRYWQIRGHFAEGRERLARLLDAPETQTPNSLRANALNWRALLSVFTGDLDGAEISCRAGLAIWEQAGEGRGASGSLGILGIIAANRGEYGVAEKWYRQALEGARAAGDQAGEAGTLGYLGINAANQGYYEEARNSYEASLQLRRTLNDVWGIAASLNNLGQLARKNGERLRARDLLSESLALRRQLRDRRNIGITLNVLALLAWEQDDLQEASFHLREATDLFDQLGDRRNIAYALETWARIAVKTGESERPLRLYETAKHLREKLGSPLPPAEQTELERCFMSAHTAGRDGNDTMHTQQEQWTLEHALTEARAVGMERQTSN